MPRERVQKRGARTVALSCLWPQVFGHEGLSVALERPWLAYGRWQPTGNLGETPSQKGRLRRCGRRPLVLSFWVRICLCLQHGKMSSGCSGLGGVFGRGMQDTSQGCSSAIWHHRTASLYKGQFTGYALHLCGQSCNERPPCSLNVCHLPMPHSGGPMLAMLVTIGLEIVKMWSRS